MGQSAAAFIAGPMAALLGGLQRIPIHLDRGLITVSTKVVSFSYKDWIEDPTEVIRNGEVQATDAYVVNQANGTLTFFQLKAGDEVRASYRFKFFTDGQLSEFLNLALQDINNFRPETSFTLDNSPNDWENFIALWAYAHALDTLSVDLGMWAARLIFPDPASFLTTVEKKRSDIQALYNGQIKRIKGWKHAAPRSVASGRWRQSLSPQQQDLFLYTVLRQ